MITRAKEKVKKVFSRRSRSSRSSSSSRDNMSVDSGHRSHVSREEEEEIPAVPQSCFRIRILTMVEQIVVRNDYEWEALDLLKKQSFGHAKRFETYFLLKIGLKQDWIKRSPPSGWRISSTSLNQVRTSWPWNSSSPLPLKKPVWKLKFTFGSLTNNFKWP